MLLQISQGFTLEILQLPILLQLDVTCTNVAVASGIWAAFRTGGFNMGNYADHFP
jgi:hypothetical protein